MGNIIRGNNGEILDVTIRDFSGAKIQGFKSNSDDEVTNTSIIKILIEKYGVKLDLDRLKKDLNRKEEGDWLSTDSEFLKF